MSSQKKSRVVIGSYAIIMYRAAVETLHFFCAEKSQFLLKSCSILKLRMLAGLCVVID